MPASANFLNYLWEWDYQPHFSNNNSKPLRRTCYSVVDVKIQMSRNTACFQSCVQQEYADKDDVLTKVYQHFFLMVTHNFSV